MELGLLITIQSALFLILDLYVLAKAYKERKVNDKHLYFIGLAFSSSVLQLTSFLVRMVKTKMISCGITWQYIIYIFMFISMVTSALEAMRYLIHLCNLGIKQTKAVRFVMALPCALISVIVLTSPWSHWFFYLDSSLTYHRGSLFFLQIIGPLTYTIATLVMIIGVYIRDKNKNMRHVIRYLACFILPTIGGMFLQIVFNVDGGYSAIGVSICVILLYMEFYVDEIREIEHINEQRTKDELIQNNARILALEDNFEVLYDVELETGKYDIFVKGETFGDVNNHLINNNSFFDDVEKNLNVVFPEDRQGNLDVTRPDFIREALSKDDHFDRYYRLLVNEKPAWAKMRIVYKDTEKKNIIIGVFNAENDVEAKQIAEQKELLEKQQIQLKEQLALTDGLAREYHTVWILENSGAHKMHLYRSTGKTTIQSAVQLGLDEPDYDSAIVKYIHDYVHEDDQERVLEETKFETIERETPEIGTYVVSYRRYNPENTSYDYHQMVYAKAESEEGKVSYIFAYRDADKMLREQIAQQNQIKESLTFTNFFLDTYISAYYVNLNDYSYQVYKRTEALNADYPVIDNYYESLKIYIEHDVHPDDREELVKLFAPENLRNILNEVPEYSHFYRSVSYGDEKIVRVQVIRGADENYAAFGFVDVTEEMKEQQKRLLGAMPLSNDVLPKANIGLWAFELDEGNPPRMYVDETMLGLIGLDHQVSPEETYHAWYDYIDEDSYDLVNDAVSKMSSGEHAEVQYPWHNPDGGVIIVRCGGIRNYEYTKGIRIEGTHQNVTQTLHFDEEARKRAKQIENDLIISKLRADSLAYISDNEPDLDNAINFFGQQILEISGCDQVIYRELDGRKIVLNAPGIEEVPETICLRCPFSKFDNNVFHKDGTVLMNDCRQGYEGVMTPEDCPAKSSFMQMIYSGGDLVGKLTVHYLNDYHTFTENGLSIMKVVAVYLGLLIGRIKEKQADIARIEAESSNKAKTEFLFNMSHDIRTPMNAILGYTNIALNHVDEPERVNDSLKKIKTSGGHLLNLINDILEMSRIEAGRLEIINTPVNIYEVTEGITYMSQALASAKDISFNSRIGELNNPYIYSDELHINQIIINLISNAIKYTNPGGTVDYSIDQISEPIDGIADYRVTVKDNGIGMSEEFQKHLFESFAREQTTTVSKQEGAGLGLAIVKRIVDLIGGTISVQSKQGVGTTFIIEIPQKVMDAEAIEKFRKMRSKGDTVRDDFELEGKKVLLVEDNEMNREISTDLLTDAGLDVELAEDGEIAVNIVRQKGTDYYDFILMDIQMPVMNGYEATKAIRELPDGDRVPIIALSANAFEEDKQKSIAMGMDAHIAKPIDVDLLFETMCGLI